jgi:hypothetical protein
VWVDVGNKSYGIQALLECVFFLIFFLCCFHYYSFFYLCIIHFFYIFLLFSLIFIFVHLCVMFSLLFKFWMHSYTYSHTSYIHIHIQTCIFVYTHVYTYIHMAIDTYGNRQVRTCLGGVGHTHTHTNTDLGIEGEHTCHLGDRFTNTGYIYCMLSRLMYGDSVSRVSSVRWWVAWVTWVALVGWVSGWHRGHTCI